MRIDRQGFIRHTGNPFACVRTARIGGSPGLRDVEAQEASGCCKPLNTLPQGENGVLVHCQTSERSGILALRQVTPQIEAAARHEPGPDAKGRQPACHFVSGPRKPLAQFLHVLAVCHP